MRPYNLPSPAATRRVLSSSSDAVVLLQRDSLPPPPSVLSLQYLIILQPGKRKLRVRVTGSNDRTIKANKHHFPSHAYLIAYCVERLAHLAICANEMPRVLRCSANHTETADALVQTTKTAP